jgi:predicted PolB exonuclease-like 3'-5' exonuclease
MIRTVADHVWAFDLEWVPDPASGRRVYDLPPDMPDDEVIEIMWREGGATDEVPHPYLKTMLCRVVSIAAVTRKQCEDRVLVSLTSLPHTGDETMPEREMLRRFLVQLGQATPKPQLVGFNSRDSDLPILIQRGIAHGLNVPAFCARPGKPWEGYDYFSKNGDGHLDLREIVSGFGKTRGCTLHEFASVSGIPGKMGTKGSDVMSLWVAGDIRTIVEYNHFDALTTYLLWLRTARFAGLFSEEAFAAEEDRVRDLLQSRIAAGDEHLARYRDRWTALAADTVAT